MINFTLPGWVKKNNFKYDSIENISKERIQEIRAGLKQFHVENPEVSIVIPAYNEEKNILKTLASLSKIKTKYRTELIVANNNSTDRTQQILELLDVKNVYVYNQGISYARQAGLEAARGKYILNADSDSIYPSTWIDPFVKKLKDEKISCVYGSYSFIPGDKTSRASLAAYEMIARTFFILKRKNRECVNVMGFNFAFRREDGLKVGGYNHDLQRNITKRSEDGWMALTLMQVGKIEYINSQKITVWTSDRRLMEDGGLGQAFMRRIKKEVLRIGVYFRSVSLNN
jgi:glycosyltransferase involved in cell wall biosynthesis